MTAKTHVATKAAFRPLLLFTDNETPSKPVEFPTASDYGLPLFFFRCPRFELTSLNRRREFVAAFKGRKLVAHHRQSISSRIQQIE